MALRDLLIQLKIVSDTKQLEAVDRKIAEVKEHAHGLIGGLSHLAEGLEALGAALAVEKIAEFVHGTIEAAHETGNLAAQVGLSTDAYQQWIAFIGKAGGSAENLTVSMRVLAQHMEEAAKTGKGPGADAFKNLGVNVKDSSGHVRDMSDVLFEIGGKLNDTADVTQRTANAATLLGRGGLAMIPAFKGGTKAARENFDAMKELSVVYSEEFIESSEKAEGSLMIMGLQFKKLRVALVTGLVPKIIEFANWAGKLANKISELFKNTTALRVLFSALGGLALSMLLTKFGGIVGIVTKLGGALRIAAGAFMRFILPALILDDIITGLQGGDSVFRDILNSFLGEKGAQEFIDNINKLISEAIPKLVAVFKAAGPAIKAALGIAGQGLSLLGEAYVGLFDLIGMGFAKTEAEQDQHFSHFMTSTRELTDGMDAAFSWVGKQFQALWTGIKDFASGVWTSMGNAFRSTFIDPILAGLAAIDAFFAKLTKSNPVLAKLDSAIGNLAGGAASALGFSVPAAVPATLPGGSSKSATLTDQRTVNITVGGTATPGETGRATAAAVGVILNSDRRASLAALGG